MGDLLSPQGSSGISVENGGTPVSGGPFNTINVTGATASDEGGGVAGLVIVTPTVEAAIFGSGRDGAITFDGSTTIQVSNLNTTNLSMAPSASVYTLARDLYCTNVTINNGVTVNTAGFYIFATGTATITGTLRCNGGNGGNGAGGLGGAAGAAAISGGTGSYGNTSPGVVGGAANAAGQNGTMTNTGHIGTATSAGLGSPNGLNGGTLQGGGGGTGTSVGGVTPTISTPNWSTRPGLDTVQNLIAGRSPAGTVMGTGISGGSGGGGAPGTGGGGGSGAAGGFVGLIAKTITGAGTIEAKGGNGGNGQASGNTGGGGGGSGGVIGIATTSSFPLSVTLTTTGGTGGTPNGTGGTGGNGGSGITYLFEV